MAAGGPQKLAKISAVTEEGVEQLPLHMPLQFQPGHNGHRRCRHRGLVFCLLCLDFSRHYGRHLLVVVVLPVLKQGLGCRNGLQQLQSGSSWPGYSPTHWPISTMGQSSSSTRPPSWAGTVTTILNTTSSAFAASISATTPPSDSLYGMKYLIWWLDSEASSHMTGRIDF